MRTFAALSINDIYEKEQIYYHVDNYCHRAGVDDGLHEA